MSLETLGQLGLHSESLCQNQPTNQTARSSGPGTHDPPLCTFIWPTQGLARRSLWEAPWYEMRRVCSGSSQCVSILKFRLDVEKLRAGPNCSSLPNQALGVVFYKAVTLVSGQLHMLISEPDGERISGGGKKMFPLGSMRVGGAGGGGTTEQGSQDGWRGTCPRYGPLERRGKCVFEISMFCTQVYPGRLTPAQSLLGNSSEITKKT